MNATHAMVVDREYYGLCADCARLIVEHGVEIADGIYPAHEVWGSYHLTECEISAILGAIAAYQGDAYDTECGNVRANVKHES
jgi:hypothetical protein